jgi:hypothetical protein
MNRKAARQWPPPPWPRPEDRRGAKAIERYEYCGDTIRIWQAPDGRWGYCINANRRSLKAGAPMTRSSAAIFKTSERAMRAVEAIIDDEVAAAAEFPVTH